MQELERIKIAQTMAFAVLSFGELVHVFNIRNNQKSIFRTGILGNPKLILAIALSLVLVCSILWIPVLRNIFSISILPAENILEVIILVFSPIVVVEVLKFFKINTLKEE